MTIEIVMVSQEIQDLQAELQQPDHRELLREMQAHPACDTFGNCLAFIAAKFEIIVDGAYGPDDFDRLAGILANKLYSSRKMIVLSPVNKIQLLQ